MNEVSYIAQTLIHFHVQRSKSYYLEQKYKKYFLFYFKYYLDIQGKILK